MNTPLTDVPQLSALMDAMVEAFIISDKDGTIERFNKSAERMFGWTASEMLGRNVSELMTTYDREHHDQYMGDYMRTGERRIIGIGREVMAQRRDGSEFQADLAIAEVKWNSESRFIGLIRDISDRKQAEERAVQKQEEMLRASRLTTMGEMAAAMAHELNQPLAAISNYASAARKMLASESADNADIDSALAKITNQAHRAAEVIRQLRNFVKYDDSHRELESIPGLLEEIIPLAALDAKANNISLDVHIEPDLPDVVADRLQIQQVALNLLRNGVDAMHESDASHRTLKLTARLEKPDTFRIEVSDQGTGVSETVAKTLFDTFFTTKSTGMGMGLAICRTIVHAHGGTLEFCNNPEHGATFSFTLPTSYEQND